MTITITVKRVYGTDKIYPACSKSETFARLTKTKTLSLSDLKAVTSLGFEVLNQVAPNVTVPFLPEGYSF